MRPRDCDDPLDNSATVICCKPARTFSVIRGRGATGSRGSVDPPLFEVRGPHMDVDPPLL